MPKENFNEKLTALLKTHSDFLDDAGELIRRRQRPRMATQPRPHQTITHRRRNKDNLL